MEQRSGLVMRRAGSANGYLNRIVLLDEILPVALPETIEEPLLWLPGGRPPRQNIYRAFDEDFQERFEAQITRLNGLAGKANLLIGYQRQGLDELAPGKDGSLPRRKPSRARLKSFQKARTMDNLLSNFSAQTSASIHGFAAFLFERNPSVLDLPQIPRFIHDSKETSASLELMGLKDTGCAARTFIDSGIISRNEPRSGSGTGVLLLPPPEYSGEKTAPAIATAPAEPGEQPWTEAAPDFGPCAAEGNAPETAGLPATALQHIADLVSELVLTRNQIEELSRQHGTGEIETSLERLAKVTSGLRDAVMRAQMQPMTPLFAGLPGLIRALQTEFQKKFDLVIEGADTVSDAKLIEAMRHPLAHLIRNCANHGIENPPERIAAGKPEAGRISICAFSNSGEVSIEIADDGRGLDACDIGETAVERGLADARTVAGMSDEEVYRFILEPGFPAASAVTAGSGRCMGMAAIRASIEALGGTISIRSQKGHGSKFILKIPLTLAIAPALIVQAGGQRFAVPQLYLERAVCLDGETQILKTVDNVHILRIREEPIPAVSLSKVLDLPDTGRMEDKLVIVLSVRGQKLGIIADAIGEIQDIVVKPLGPLFSSLTMFSGNTILGDGTVILILDPAGLADAMNIQKISDILPSLSVRNANAAAPSSLLLFKAGAGALKVLPRPAVSKILQIPAQDLSQDGDIYLYLYEERLIPVLRVEGAEEKRGTCLILVIALYNQIFGLWVDSVLDIVESQAGIQLISSSPALLGTAVLHGSAVEFIDAGYYYRMAFEEPRRPSAGKAELLIAGSGTGMHELLKPLLISAGHKITAVETADQASELLRHRTFGVILLDAKAASRIDEAALARQSDALCLIFNDSGNEGTGEPSGSTLDCHDVLKAVGRHLSQPPGAGRKAANLNLPHDASFAGSL